MIDAATKCLADVEEVLQSIAKLKGKVVQVYSEEELLDTTKPLVYPACGVTYEGMRSVAEAGATMKTGNSAELVMSIILIDTAVAVTAASNVKKQTPPILDAIRDLMMGRKSPTGHRWRFIVEASAVPKSGTVIWVQRWSCPVQLISSLNR